MTFVVRFLPVDSNAPLPEPPGHPDAIPPDDGGHGIVQRLSGTARRATLRRPGQLGYALVGRVRLDRRDALIAALKPKFADLPSAADDTELCLRACIAWGEHAPDHLHGDFAFVFWVEGNRELLCARDRIGVRSLAYCERDGAWWVSDSLQELAAAQSLADRELDPVWIADFLADGHCNDPARTVYEGVRRLAPAHVLTISADGAALRRYWQLELAEPLFLSSPAAYADQFRYLLAEAVRDRMPRGNVGILLSGGLDSSTLATTAVETTGAPGRIATRTWLVDPDRDPEAKMSRLIADHLGIAHELVDSVGLHFDPAWRARPARSVEPGMTMVIPPVRATDLRAMERQAQVWFYGEGPDNALTFEWRAYLRWLAGRGMALRLAGAIGTYLATKSLREWRTTLGVWTGMKRIAKFSDDPPDWVREPARDLAGISDAAVRSWRPAAMKSFRGGLWPQFLESLDADYAATAIEWCHPYLDLRVLEFMLRTPPIPWGRRKRLIRYAMRGRLPRAILRRDKTPLHHDPIAALLRRAPPALPAPGTPIERYVDLARLARTPTATSDPYALLRVAMLDHWLNTRHD